MSDSYRVSFTLTETEAIGVKTILDQLINIDLFKELPLETYTALEKFVAAAHTELKIKEMASRKGYDWGEKCGLCYHSSKDHVKDTGLCSKESCGPCFAFVPTGKPY